jgi:calcineurin-like phosphoesterase family protein/2'-5' RNA ligase
MRECNLPKSKVHRVPHISLYGSFYVPKHQQREVVEIIKAISRKYTAFQYTIDGFGEFPSERGKVIYCRITPSPELVTYRQEIANSLQSRFPSSKPWDKEEEFHFHATIAYKLTESEFKRTWKFVKGQKNLLQRLLGLKRSRNQQTILNLSYQYTYALRTTLLNNESKILFEYDYLQKRSLRRVEAKSGIEWRESLRLFRVSKGMEDCFDTGSKIYLISDLHLDHANIIKYCSRPFLYNDVHEMNGVLVNNWNNVVRDNPVYFLGDLSYGRNSKPADNWLKKLSGLVTFVRGNHEQARNSKDYHILEYKGRSFLLVHDPDHIPINWNGWVIHGHKHDNDLRNYPFISGKKKTINVSAEVVNYKPVSLDYILSLNIDSIDRMDVVDSIPVRR